MGFGFRGGCWLWGPVGVHAEFLGQMHVSRLGCYVARAAQPGKTLGRVPVDALLEKEKGKKKNTTVPRTKQLIGEFAYWFNDKQGLAGEHANV